MGLYGIVVVTSAPSGSTAGAAYPGVIYNADVSLLFSEIDPIQNKAVAQATSTAGFSESSTYNAYIGAPVASIDLSSGGTGYTSATVMITGGGGSGATATAVLDGSGHITAINIVNAGNNYSSTPSVTITGTGSGAAATVNLDSPQLRAAMTRCGGGAAACYPPIVNYSPRYYLINGVAFDKTNASRSLFMTDACHLQYVHSLSTRQSCSFACAGSMWSAR